MSSVLAFNTRQFTWYIDVVLVLGITLAYLVSASNSSKSLPVSIFDQRKQKDRAIVPTVCWEESPHSIYEYLIERFTVVVQGPALPGRLNWRLNLSRNCSSIRDLFSFWRPGTVSGAGKISAVGPGKGIAGAHSASVVWA
ncbi:hypothetical protein MGG_17660 [Pyricularia oryzae 70-15]|uniref:Uncharacterized protein n=1 Tax=Pyricularia oryzae (strain 70-15 / ATCC MYA-4617 / FGSC 8958) TaxID=242507 RepID=G4NFF3_PYRO7|nr:uncharacterized protein MGG_17660 [Pyricularia oryzae 70-15]EHA47181.1 hypothetical protein MGG_17660 [Pyricularia oryzae 70-15]